MSATDLSNPTGGPGTGAAFYDRAYHGRRHAHLLRDDEYFWARARASARFYFTPAERARRVLEVGCGIGQGIAALPDAAGYDPSAEARRACRARGLRVFDRPEDIPERAFDILFHRHCLEHVEDPLAHLADSRRWLRPQGYLYLVLPCERDRPCPMPYQPDLNQHLFAWTFRTANNLLRRAGWEPFENRLRWVLGYRRLLPVRRLFGEAAYFHACCAVGRLWRNAEKVIKAQLPKGGTRD